MSDRPDDSQARQGEGFSARWSRRKTAERERAKDADLEAIPEPAESQLKSSALTNTERETETEPETAPEIAPEDLPDVESLEKDSDYTPFMQTGVPEWLRRKALRKLWLSDPVLANLDGLNDYDEDYSAIGMVAQEIASRYQPGRGYRDEEAEAEAEAPPEDAPKEETKEDTENISGAEEEPISDAAEADVEGAEIADSGGEEIFEGDDTETAEAAAVDDSSDKNI